MQSIIELLIGDASATVAQRAITKGTTYADDPLVQIVEVCNVLKGKGRRDMIVPPSAKPGVAETPPGPSAAPPAPPAAGKAERAAMLKAPAVLEAVAPSPLPEAAPPVTDVGQDALNEIRGLGIQVTPDSDLQSLVDQLTVQRWGSDSQTLDYIEGAIKAAKAEAADIDNILHRNAERIRMEQALDAAAGQISAEVAAAIAEYPDLATLGAQLAKAEQVRELDVRLTELQNSMTETQLRGLRRFVTAAEQHTQEMSQEQRYKFYTSNNMPDVKNNRVVQYYETMREAGLTNEEIKKRVEELFKKDKKMAVMGGIFLAMQVLGMLTQEETAQAQQQSAPAPH